MKRSTLDSVNTVTSDLKERSSEILSCRDLHIRSLRLGKPPVFLWLPIIRPDRRDRVEHIERIVFRLDRLKLGIVGAIEDFLEVWLSEVSFVEVGRAIGSQLRQSRHEYFCHQLLARQHVLPRSGEVPGSGDVCVDESVTPAWVDGVVGVLGNFEGG